MGVRSAAGDRTPLAGGWVHRDSVLVGDRPTYPEDVAAFVPTSILAAHLARLPEERQSVMIS
jgi:hypothetical protein